MGTYNTAKGIDVIILCGGRGKRLRAIVNDRPKPMAEFDQRPFLSILMEYVASFGFQRFILCTGYMAETIRKYYSASSLPWEILFSEEKKALGTGGAIKRAESLIRSDPFIVMNGDSFCRLDLDKFVNFHLKKRALLSIALVDSKNNKNCGKVILDETQRIIRFKEKAISTVKHFNSVGIYLMDKDFFSYMKKGNKFSLEYDLFPCIIDKRCYGFKQDADLIDFGTPIGYKRAQYLFSKGPIR